ncbi:MAG: energy transducer TonB [Prevotellaceae bacterium]|jgi:TonB family protein|nr:energy transducer TonB [Prevotellaceae bacterium]
MNKEKKTKSYHGLSDYIRGKRKGAGANHIEREATADAFLYEALEGIDSVDGNHVKNIENLREKIMKQAARNKKHHRKVMIWGAAASINTIFTWSAAACVSLGIAGGLIYFSTSGSDFGTAVSGNDKTYYNSDFVSKIKNSEKNIVAEELLLPSIIEPPMPRNIEIHSIESDNIKIVEKRTNINDILNFDKDSIIAENHKIDYVSPQRLEDETYLDENIPFAVVEEYPKFMGQDANAFKDWVQERLKYPETGDCIQGKVILNFVVNKMGNVININVVGKLSPELDAEAVRVVSSSPQWMPAKQKNIPVDFEYTFPISFSLKY